MTVRGLIAYNPVHDARKALPRRPRPSKAWATESELHTVLNAKPEAHKALVYTALVSGAVI